MARIVTRSLPLASITSLSPRRPISAALCWPSLRAPTISSPLSPPVFLLMFSSDAPGRKFQGSRRGSFSHGMYRSSSASLRGYEKVRRRRAPRKRAPKERQPELDIKICIEEELPEDPDIMSISEALRVDVPMAMGIAFYSFDGSDYKTRDISIVNFAKFEKVELSVLLCNDDFIRRLNKDWRDEDHSTDVLSMSQHIPNLDLPILMLGDIVISVETAARQAEERGHTLLDEIRILMVHGLLHLLGFDHEISDEAEAEMEKGEELVLSSLGWKGKGLIKSAYDAVTDVSLHADCSNGEVDTIEKEGSMRYNKPKFSYIFCDMDGTLLNSKSQINAKTAEAVKEAISRGVNIVIATGKSRPAVISALEMGNLAGKDGVVSELSPGVFLQGLLVYGRHGQEIYRRNLDQDICREAFFYSLEHQIPLVAFCEDRCLTLFEHPLVDALHSVYHEPKAEIMPSVKQLLAVSEIQKLLFLGTAEGVSSILRPYWSEATEGRANVIQAVPNMLEIVPPGTSKGAGVKLLLDHLGIAPKEIMAIGDGENDVEMLQLASLGIALANASDKAKAVADVIGATNDEDGVAEALYQYAF